jgi:hypothetical protein
MGYRDWAGTLTCKQYHLQAESWGGGQARKICLHKTARSGGTERMRELGRKFFECPTIMSEETTQNEAAL